MQRITSIQTGDKRKQSLIIELNGQPWREVDAEVVIKLGLRQGDALSPEQQSIIDQENAYVLARRRAVNFCVVQPRSRLQVQRLLERKHFKPAIIERVMQELSRQHLLRERDLARKGVRKAQRHKLGPRRTKAELAAHGVKDEVIEEELKEIQDPQWQKQQVITLAQQRLLRLQKLDQETQRRRLADYLLRRGFDGGVVQDVINELCPQDM